MAWPGTWLRFKPVKSVWLEPEALHCRNCAFPLQLQPHFPHYIALRSLRDPSGQGPVLEALLLALPAPVSVGQESSARSLASRLPVAGLFEGCFPFLLNVLQTVHVWSLSMRFNEQGRQPTPVLVVSLSVVGLHVLVFLFVTLDKSDAVHHCTLFAVVLSWRQGRALPTLMVSMCAAYQASQARAHEARSCKTGAF